MNQNDIYTYLSRAIVMSGQDAGQLGEAFQLISCGCEFSTHMDDAKTKIYLEIEHKDFSTFEGDRDHRATLRVDISLGEPSPVKMVHSVMDVKTDYTTDQLLGLCKSGAVPEDKWGNRDSADAQKQMGRLRGLLMAGEAFDIITIDEHWVTDNNTVRVRCNGETFYLPTQARLDQRAGRDWY